MSELTLDTTSFDTPLRRTIFSLLSLGPLEAGKLQQIIYLADLEHFWRHGRTLSGTAWMAREYGPTSPGLDASLVVLSHEGIQFDPPLAMRTPDPDEGPAMEPVVPAYTICSLQAKLPARPGLEQTAQEVLAFIYKLAAPLKLDELTRLSFNTSPMLLAASRGGGKAQWGELITFNKNMAAEATALRGDTATTEAQQAFKRGELARIADLQQQALDQAR